MSEDLISVLVLGEELEVDPSKPQIIIKHGNHKGRLHNGKLHCTEGNWDCLFECKLDVDAELSCQLVEILDGHVHGPGCGHEMIPHGDHFDYLVGGRLHHVLQYCNACCPLKCLGPLEADAVVDHGGVDVVGTVDAVDAIQAQKDITKLKEISAQESKYYSAKRKHSPKRRKSYRWPEEDEGAVPLLADEEKRSDKPMISTSITASGICCPSEEGTIRRILEGIPGVASVDVMVMTKTVRVVHDPTQMPVTVILAALNEAGLQASLGKRKKSSGPTTSIPWHIILSGICLGIALLSVVVPGLAFLKWAALGAVAFGSPYILRRAYAALKQLQLDINILMIISAFGAIAISEYIEAGAIVFLFGFSEWLEDKCMGKARESIGFLMEMQPETAISAVTNEVVPIDQVKVNDLLLVRPGDRVPVDSVVMSGESTFDESMLTGESAPVKKSGAQEVVSGSVNSGYGSVVIRAQKLAQDSTISQLAAKVEEASVQKSKAGHIVEKFAKSYTPAVVASAALLVIIPVILKKVAGMEGVGDLKYWVYLALVLLVCACPCALVISTPVISVCGISRAAKQSVLIKGGQYLEALAHVKAITFDKTGTLTEGRFGIVDIQTLNGKSERDVLTLAASLERHSTHPMGPAIVGSAVARGITKWCTVSQMEVVEGRGIRGLADGVKVSVGNESLMGEDAPGSAFPAAQVVEYGSTCCVAADGKVVGVIAVSDTVRDDAKQCIQMLKKMGVTAGMLTGDRSRTARSVARSLGLFRSHTHSDLLPEDKLELVGEYHDTFKSVAHVGDGINDALALARANVGVAMGVGGSAMAVEAADVALFSNDLMNLPFVLGLARNARWKLIANISFSVILKVAVIVLAVLGYVQLWEAVLADVGSSVIVTLNGLTLLRYRGDLAPKGGHEGDGNKGCVSKTCCSKKVDEEKADHDHKDASKVNGEEKCCASKKRCGSKKSSDGHARDSKGAAQNTDGKKHCASKKTCGSKEANNDHAHDSKCAAQNTDGKKRCASKKACGSKEANNDHTYDLKDAEQESSQHSLSASRASGSGCC